MKKLILWLFILSNLSFLYSQWISNYGFKAGDVKCENSKGNAVVCKGNSSYVTGYTYETDNGKDIATIKYNSQGDTMWVRCYNGTANSDDEGLAIYADENDYIYVTGYVQNSGNQKDAVILKYSVHGELLWVRTLSFSLQINSNDDKGVSITADDNGYVYATGYTTGPDGYTDIFAVKADPTGNVIWSAIEDGVSNLNAEGTSLVIDSENNIYICGFVTSSVNNTDIIVIKYGANRWIKTINGSGNSEDKAWGIVVDESDNVYITGYITNSDNNTDTYTACLSPSGQIVWSKTYNGSGNESDKAWGIIIDEDDDVFITGETTADNNNINYLTIKYNNQGQLIWNKTYNGPGNGEDKSAAISLYRNKIVVTGKSWGSDNTYDIATVSYLINNGNQVEVNRYSMAENSNDLAKDIASKGNIIVVTGYSVIKRDNASSNSYISTLSPGFSSQLESKLTVPAGFSLQQNFPNPFNPVTSIQFNLGELSYVKLSVYDVLGKEVSVLINQQLEAGSHKITFIAGNLSSGIYFYKLEAGSFSEIKKMTLVK